MVPSAQRRSHSFGFVALGLFAVVALASCNAGWVNPFAGDGAAGTSTSTVPDAQARFTDPTGVVAIPGGGFYVYDAATCAIYKESRGQTSVYAGTPGTCGNTGDGGQATAATLDNSPAADPNTRTSMHGPGRDAATPMTVGLDGSVYFVEVTIVGWQTSPPNNAFPEYHSQVRRIAPDGTITAVGNGIASSLMDVVIGVTTAPDGKILVATGHVGSNTTDIAQIAPDGTQTAVTSTTEMFYAIAAISDTQVAAVTSSTIYRVDLTTGISTSTGYSPYQSAAPIAAAPDGTIYVGSVAGNTVVKIAPDNSVTTIAGSGSTDPGTTAQTGDGLSLNLTPTGLALTPNHGLLISSGHVVYRLEDPVHAGTPELGSPLNYFGGTCAYRPQSPSTPSSPITTAPCPVG